ncbi:hypothetical protein ARMSODRAFT_715979 [Armillaria solidipes]|uniref:Extracellular membrane protein CFEM domain-containing protein n=1 Tax=Armillaria solidipes TaxID=1076256 RepID=A0A2H3CCV6_9AGAR|nr:hypothetical protein ARMSODRAFT_715979 [Armillaria solidipes]
MSVMALSQTFLFLLLGVQLHNCVTALDPRSLSWNRALHFASRQVSGIPSQCQTPCSAANALISANCTQPQCCTSGFENDYVSCIECVGSAANITDYTVPQTTVDELVVSCSLKGIVIPKVTFPGQDPNRQLATSAIASPTSGAASGTGGGSSTPTSLSTSIITPVTSQTAAASISSISRSTITSIAPASSVSVTERSSAPASASTTPAASGTADSAVAMESEILWIVPTLVAFFFWA